MTEDEAKKKWCPEMHKVNALLAITTAILTETVSKLEGADSTGKVLDNAGRIVDNKYCIASDCMMWKEVCPDDDKITDGYCGLASK